MRSAVRLRVRLSRRSLDRRLASGADPGATPALQLRAAQLTAPGSRRALADGVEAIRRTQPDAEGELAALALRLRAPEPIRPAGAAAARLFLQRGAGDAPEPVWERAWAITDALNHHAR